MSNPTSNFGWQMPTPTDLVTDLPADFEVFGQAVDTSLADLRGGTTGQVLSKTTNTDMDFTWVSANPGDITGVTAGTGISGGGTSGAVTITNDMATTITASGDIVVGTGSGTYDNLPIGTTGQVLTADTTVSPYKVKWATAGGTTFPTFSAYLASDTTPTTNVWTKIPIATEEFDTASNYDTSNYRFTPTTAGYYQINASAYIYQTSSGGQLFAIYKNGSQFKSFGQIYASTGCLQTGGTVIYFNGSTDYVEVYGRGTAGTVTFSNGASDTYFSGIGIRA